VLIVGGGVAGCAASIALARQGRKVTLIEREATPRHKVCGEFLSGEALEDLHALVIDVSALGAVPLGYVRLAASRRATEAPLPFHAASLTRRALDTALIAEAVAAGVHVLCGCGVKSLSRTVTGLWQATLEDGIYTRLSLLQLIPTVAEAFVQERITASHANLIARLPQEHQADAFENCWRKDWQDKEAHLLPAKHLSSWIQANLYLNLAEAPFDRQDTTLKPEAGACIPCPRRSGFNTSLFADVQGDRCKLCGIWANCKSSLLALR